MILFWPLTIFYMTCPLLLGGIYNSCTLPVCILPVPDHVILSPSTEWRETCCSAKLSSKKPESLKKADLLIFVRITNEVSSTYFHKIRFFVVCLCPSPGGCHIEMIPKAKCPTVVVTWHLIGSLFEKKTCVCPTQMIWVSLDPAHGHHLGLISPRCIILRP